MHIALGWLCTLRLCQRHGIICNLSLCLVYLFRSVFLSHTCAFCLKIGGTLTISILNQENRDNDSLAVKHCKSSETNEPEKEAHRKRKKKKKKKCVHTMLNVRADK